ncbi:MAG: hypothetical protein EOO20_17080 [Chryseobacterium sp.]|nr:MAG: hypothetical protein EOO20_17080 [Chryseobacterium sp.]
MTEKKFQVGETVQLNSGSPVLTISNDKVFGAQDFVEVIWYLDGEFHKQELDSKMLTAYPYSVI